MRAKQFITFMFYRMKIIVHNPKQLLLLLCLPLLVVALLETVISKTVVEGKIPIAVVDEDDSDYSRTVIARVAKTPHVALEMCSRKEAVRRIEAQTADLAFVFKEGFQANIAQGQYRELVDLIESPASLSSGLLKEVVASEIMRFVSNATAANDVVAYYTEKGLITAQEKKPLWQEAWHYTDAQWEPEPLATMVYREGGDVLSLNGDNTDSDDLRGKVDAARPNEDTDGAGDVNPEVRNTARTDAPNTEAHKLTDEGMRAFGLLSVALMLLTFYLNDWLVKEKQQHVLTRVSVVGASKLRYIVGNGCGASLLVFVSFLLAAGYFISGASLSWWRIVLVCVVVSAYIGACFSIATLFASFARGHKQMHLFGLMTVVATSVIGGSFINLAEVSSRFASLAALTPQQWLLSAVRGTLSEGDFWTTVPKILPSLGVFAAAGVVLLSISLLLLEGRHDRA